VPFQCTSSVALSVNTKNRSDANGPAWDEFERHGPTYRGGAIALHFVLMMFVGPCADERGGVLLLVLRPIGPIGEIRGPGIADVPGPSDPRWP